MVMLVGRETEFQLVLSALNTGTHLLIEGPPGTGKSALIDAAFREVGIRPVLMAGSLTSTVGQLVGSHDPGLVLATGFSSDSFQPGPLVRAMTGGRPLFLDSVNLLPPEVVSALVSAMSEGAVDVPRFGEVRARTGFVVVATANPARSEPASRLPQAFLDRVSRLALGYLAAPDERAIVTALVPSGDRWISDRAVDVSRASRLHPDLSYGASVRGAVDLVAVAHRLSELTTSEIGLRAAYLALSSRIAVRPGVDRSVEAVIRELWMDAEISASRATGPPRRQGHEFPPSALTALRTEESDDAASAVGEDEPDSVSPAAAIDPVRSGVGGGNARVSLSGGAPAVVSEVALETQHAIADLVQHDATGPAAGRVRRAEMADLTVEQVEAMAAQIVVRRTRETAHPVPASGGRLTSVRYNFRSDDIDLDRTVDSLVEHPVPSHRDIWVRDRVPRRRGVALILDVSGSMRGERLIEVAMAAAAATIALQHDELSVVAFARGAEVIARNDGSGDAHDVVRRVMRLRPEGLTALADGLMLGRRELRSMRAQRHTAIVMTDGVENLGADPVAAARSFRQLSVLATTNSSWRLARCRRLAEIGSGRCVSYANVSELPGKLSDLLAV